ncbi:MAG: hypothetical protein EOP47_25420 [Sphingobacteriaceae bacterium]|nr:MAG: hypothetical protein EOP47_25420 [Sphingobacteriaceae bacterium]
MRKNLNLTICLILTSAVILFSCKKQHKKNEPVPEPVKSDSTAIIAYSIPNQLGTSFFTKVADSLKIIIYTTDSLDRENAIPAIQVAPGATISPASGEKVNFASKGDKITYRVTSESGSMAKWYIELRRPLVYRDPIVTAFFERTEGCIANDAGTTTLLDDGRVLWTLGDTYIDRYRESDKTVPCLFQVRNAALLQPANNWNWRQTQTLLSPAKGTLYQPIADGKYFNWPSGGFQIGDTVFVYSGNYESTGGGGFGFKGTGIDMLVKMKYPEMTVAGYHYLPRFNDIGFGSSFDKDADGFTYTYGFKQTFIYNDVFAARFPSNNPYAAWTFWDGTGWSTDIKKIKRIGESASSGAHIAKVKNKFVLVSSQFSVGCDQGKEIYIASSNNRTGPYTTRKKIYTIDGDKLDGHYPFFYAPILHPEFINEKNEILITYAVNGFSGCFNTCKSGRMDPDTYRLRGIRVPLYLIDSSF